MRQRNGLRVVGARELEEAFIALGARVGGQTMVRGLKKASKPIAAALKAAAPEDSGQLITTIVSRVIRSGSASRTVGTGPTTDGFYGRMLEEGTSKLAAAPWARPAWASLRPTVVRVVVVSLWDALVKTARKWAAKAPKSAPA